MSASKRRVDVWDRSVQSSLLGVRIRVASKNRRVSGGERHTSSSGKSGPGEKRQTSLVEFLEGTRERAGSPSKSSSDLREGTNFADAAYLSSTIPATPARSSLWQSSDDQNELSSSRSNAKRKHAQDGEQQQEGSSEKKRKRLTSSRRRPSSSSFKTPSVYDSPPGAASSSNSSPSTATRANQATEVVAGSNDDETQVLSWNSYEEEVPRPPLSLLKRNNPDRKKLRVNHRAVAYASAISPKKKKSLIEQSAKDYAIQQARRSKSPLQAIDNLAMPSNIRGRDKTPSPLRAGFSLIQVDRSNAPDSSETEDEGDPPSPLRERGVSPDKRIGLQSVNNEPRIYAYETQVMGGPRSSRDVFDFMEPSLLSTSVHDESGGAKSTSSACSRDCHASNKVSANNHSSSQTAPGGSWPNGAQCSSQGQLTEVSNGEGPAGANSWRGRPRKSSSSSLYEDIDVRGTTSIRISLSSEDKRAASGARKRRSNVRTGVQLSEGRQMSMVSTDDELPSLDSLADLTSLHLVEDETQPLPWEENDDAGQVPAEAVKQQDSRSRQDASETQAPLLSRRARVPSDWANLNDVWSAHLYDNVSGASAAPSTKKRHQSQLNAFGFSRSSMKSSRDEHPMSDAEDVSSSDEDNDECGDTSITGAGSSAPQSSQVSMSIPSDSGLDSQVRQFFDVL